MNQKLNFMKKKTVIKALLGSSISLENSSSVIVARRIERPRVRPNSYFVSVKRYIIHAVNNDLLSVFSTIPDYLHRSFLAMKSVESSTIDSLIEYYENHVRYYFHQKEHFLDPHSIPQYFEHVHHLIQHDWIEHELME